MRMPRALALVVWLVLAGVSSVVADDTIVNDGTTRVSLKVQLERGLRAMRPVEFQFLSEVLKQVKDGTLPQDMVEQAFLWASRQRAYRVQYFEKALASLAQQNNITFQTKVSSFDPGFNQGFSGSAKAKTGKRARHNFLKLISPAS
jgi:hypothetical protein